MLQGSHVSPRENSNISSQQSLVPVTPLDLFVCCYWSLSLFNTLQTTDMKPRGFFSLLESSST